MWKMSAFVRIKPVERLRACQAHWCRAASSAAHRVPFTLTPFSATSALRSPSPVIRMPACTSASLERKLLYHSVF